MALYPNGSYLSRSPGRHFGGATAAVGGTGAGQSQLLRNRTDRLNRYLSETALTVWSTPSGYGVSALIPARVAGGVSSLGRATFAVSPVATGGLGMPGSGASSFAISVEDAIGQLIVSGTGTTGFAFTSNAPLLTASINGGGAATWSITTNTPLLGALAEVSGAASMQFGTNAPTMYPLNDASPLRTAAASFAFSGLLTPYAVGHMQGSTVDNSAVTSDSIASAVWGRVIEAGYSADQIMRILASHAAGAATGLEGANPQFTGLDGVTVRIDGSYAGGTRTIDTLNGV